MAADEVKETPEVEVSPKKKKGIPLVAIIALVGVAALGGGVLVGKMLGGKGGAKAVSAAETAQKAEGKDAAKEGEAAKGEGKEGEAAKGEGKEGATDGTKKPEAGGEKAGRLDLDEFTVNLTDPFGRRYANMLISLEVEPRDLITKIKDDDLLIPKIRDMIFTIVSSKTYADMTSVAGKISLKEEMQIRINEIVKQSLQVEPVKSVLFNKFLIQ